MVISAFFSILSTCAVDASDSPFAGASIARLLITSLLFISYEFRVVALIAADFSASLGACSLLAQPGKITAAVSSSAAADNPHFLFIKNLLSHVNYFFPPL
ncbi:hypothetical protein D3C87_1556820 [compost metagenome]